MKKILLALTVVLIAILLGVGGYYLRSRQETPANAPPGITGGLPTTQTPGTGAFAQNQSSTVPVAAKLVLVSQNQALDYFVDKEGVIFVIQPDGKVVKVASGKAEILANNPVSNIGNASFSFDGKKIMAAIGNGTSGNRIQIFDIGQKSWAASQNVAGGASWSPNNHKIVYAVSGKSGGIYTLDTDNPRVSPVQVIKMRQDDVLLDWVLPSTILLGDRPNSGWDSSLWLLDTAKKSVSPILLDRPGLQTIWDTSFSAGLVFSANRGRVGGELSLMDRGGKQVALDFLTLPSKCAFYDKPEVQQTSSASTTSAASSKSASSPKTRTTLLCGIPRDKQALENNFLPDAYQQKAIFTSDDFFEIDVVDGTIKSVLNDPQNNIDAENIKIFNQSAFFINRYDQKVYSVRLPRQ